MISKNNKRIIRKMLDILIYTNSIHSSNISGLAVVDIFLSDLWKNREINLKQYRKYETIFRNACDNHIKKTHKIISFKG